MLQKIHQQIYQHSTHSFRFLLLGVLLQRRIVLHLRSLLAHLAHVIHLPRLLLRVLLAHLLVPCQPVRAEFPAAVAAGGKLRLFGKLRWRLPPGGLQKIKLIIKYYQESY